jgi:periplasmic divalent cation tolerance protein
MPFDFAIVLSTYPADHDVSALAHTLVEEHLAACVNVLPAMQSFYRWEGKIEQATERQLVIKTTAGRLTGLRSRLSELHPYDVPEFLVLRIEEGAESYLSWLQQSVE